MASAVTCPSDDTILGFVQGNLGREEMGRTHEHIAGCDQCRALVAEAARYPTLVSRTERPGRAKRGGRVAVVAAAAAVLLAVALFAAGPRRLPVAAPEPCTGADRAFFWAANGHCYTRHDRPLGWEEARAACHALDAELFAYSSYIELDQVDTGLARPSATERWIGLRASHREGEAPSWVTGDPLPPPGPSWAPGALAPAAGDCGLQVAAAEMHPRSKRPYRWSLAPCSRPLPYVCKRAPWTVRPATGHAYRLFHRPQSWDAAQAACAAARAHLVTIEDADEDGFAAAGVRVNIWIGANDRTREGTFVWVTGEPAAFNRFAPLEPDDPTGQNDCVAIGPEGLWHDRSCGTAYPYLCERDRR